MTSRTKAPLGAPATLLLAAAAEVVANPDPHRWRDDALAYAVDVTYRAGDLDLVQALATGYDTLLLSVPAVEDGVLVLRATGNAERRFRGAFSTPPAFANALATRALTGWPADLVPAVVDPACGAGALLRAVLARLLAAGLPPDRAARALHGVDADPIAVLLCRAVLAADLTLAGHPCRPEDLADRIVAGDALSGATPRLPASGAGVVWHELFPEVLAREPGPGEAPEPVTGWIGGFDAVVANPPWERLKVHARDWDGAPPPGLRGDRAGTARALRDAGRHPLTGAGELNAYLPFVETCWRLLAPAGRAAVLVPAGIASDRSAARLLEALTGAGALYRLHLFEPSGPIFAGVSGRLGVAVVELAGGPRIRLEGADLPVPTAEVAVGLATPDDPPGDRAWQLTASLLRELNPNTGTAPLFGSATDARIVTAVHRRIPVLLRRDPETSRVVADAWRLRLVTPLHMTNDAPHFHTSPGPGLVPLWEAKHCALLDPYGGTTREPRYWVARELIEARYGDLCARGWLAGYRNVSTTIAPRTLLPTPLPVAGVGNSLPLISATRLPLLLAALSSMPVDYLLRQKHAGANVNFFKLEQVPVPVPADYDVPSPWAPGTIADWMLERFARAVVWSPGLAGLADELRRDGVPVPTGVPTPADVPAPGSVSVKDGDAAVSGDAAVPGNPAVPGDTAVSGDAVVPVEERELARAELDAAHAVLLRLTRLELEHLLGTFSLLRRREVALHGRFVTAERVLAAYDRLA